MIDISSLVADHISAIKRMNHDQIQRAADQIIMSLRAGRKILICGNGGSAADAQHFAAEMMGRFHNDDRIPLSAIALTTDTSLLTAVANDFGYTQIFSRQVLALGHRDDVLIAITTSGMSQNVLNAIDAARDRSMHVITLTGPLTIGDTTSIEITVPSHITARIQECHEFILHVICEIVNEAFAV